MRRPSRIEPGPGQESVWDYPRPPRIEATQKHIVVIFNGVTIADTTNAIRILETSHPPSYYLPPTDLKMEYFHPDSQSSFCEFKGRARYYTLTVGDKTEVAVAWYYPNPAPPYTTISNYVALYPGRMDACYIDDELVTPQPGGFYGGWITKDIVGPFKGGEGTFGW